MDYRFLHIRSGDYGLHAPFFEFVHTNFPRTDFTVWGKYGGWTDDYEAFALLDGEQLVSTVGRTRMSLVMQGESCIGYQLGAVATLKSLRGKGLAAKLMRRALDEADALRRPVFLFANDSVLDFYPRFGFRHIAQQRFTANVQVEPAVNIASQWNIDQAEDRARLAQHCSIAVPTGQRFCARDYYSTLLWHLIDRRLAVFWLGQVQAAVVAQMKDKRLVIHDVLTSRPFDLSAALPMLTAEPVSELEFGFQPEDWWPGPFAVAPMEESPLFVYGAQFLDEEAIRFPSFAHT